MKCGSAPVGARDLEGKLADFDRHAACALARARQLLDDLADEIVTMARARLITGHFVYGDRKMFEYDAGRLDKETLEELADAVVYQSRLLDL